MIKKEMIMKCVEHHKETKTIICEYNNGQTIRMFAREYNGDYILNKNVLVQYLDDNDGYIRYPVLLKIIEKEEE